MQNMSAHDAKARFGQLLDTARFEPVTINKHGRAVAVVMSKEEFDSFEALKLEKLRAEIHQGIESIERGDFLEIEKSEILQFGDSIKTKGQSRETAE